jgi:hypothetical protein
MIPATVLFQHFGTFGENDLACLNPSDKLTTPLLGNPPFNETRVPALPAPLLPATPLKCAPKPTESPESPESPETPKSVKDVVAIKNKKGEDTAHKFYTEQNLELKEWCLFVGGLDNDDITILEKNKMTLTTLRAATTEDFVGMGLVYGPIIHIRSALKNCMPPPPPPVATKKWTLE